MYCRIILFLYLFFLNLNLSLAQPSSFPGSLPDIKFHLTARPWNPLNIPKEEYLNKVESIVRGIVKFQNSNGAIIDPFDSTEKQYSTPYFAYALGSLLYSGRATDLLNQGIAAMNLATTDIAIGSSAIPDDHGEFFIAPLANAIPFYAPFVSSSQTDIWKQRLTKPIADIIKGRDHNWRTYAMKGEWYRAKNGYVNKDSAVKWIEDSWGSTQKTRFTNNTWDFYHDETSNPDTWAYESAARGNLISMIADGYDGPSKNEILNILETGGQTSLLMQDPSGQAPAGGRSGNHTWNDIVLANSFETLAEIAKNEGNGRLAGEYRHAAALGFQSIQRWKQIDGTYSVTKNQFDASNRIRFATYSFLTTYNGTLMFHIAENYFRHVSEIPEQPAPNEIGGYTIVTDSSLATAVANAGGMQMEVSLRGSTELAYNLYWTSLGVVRFARTGWDSRIGPSDGVRETNKKYGVSFAPTFLENGNWLRLASIPDRYEAFFTTQFTNPLLVRCKVDYKPKPGQTGPLFTNEFVITPDGILSILTSNSNNFGITWPILSYDGATTLNTSFTSNIASTSFSQTTDQQNFIAIHSSPNIVTSENTRRSSYGDLLPVRMVSNDTSNVTFIYPRNPSDPSAESVRKSFSHAGSDFSSLVGRIKGNIYVGRTSAGGEGNAIDLDNDSISDITFDKTCGFVIQLNNGAVSKIETDKDVTANIHGQVINLQAYVPYTSTSVVKAPTASVIASSNDGNVPANTIDGDLNTRWSAYGNQWIRFSFDSTILLKWVNIAWYKGDQRSYAFDIQTSSDSINWITVFNGLSSGTTNGLETYDVKDTAAQYVRIFVHGNNVNKWDAITEVELFKATQTYNTSSNTILFTRNKDSAVVAQGGMGSISEYLSASNNTPVSVQLTAVDGSGNTPTWLSVNGKVLNGINYTTGSEVTHNLDATNLSVGTYSAVVTASAKGYTSGIDTIVLTVKAPSSGMLTNLKINFQDSLTLPPSGWIRDYGQAFGQRISANQGSGNVYGWIKRSDKTPIDLTKNSRKRTSPTDISLATLMHMQAEDAPSSSLTNIEGVWEIQVANGNYDVTVSVGDGSYTDSKPSINVEEVNAITSFVPTSTQKFKSATVTVSVADGLLTIDAIGGVNTKINYVIIQPSVSQRPSVVSVNPENSSENVSENTSISTDILNLPNGAIDNTTLTTASVYLTEESTGTVVASNVNGTGGGDAITLAPSAPLRLGTSYNFNITSGVKDLTGASFIPYSSTFTTGSGSSGQLLNARFVKINLPNAVGRHSSLTMGPDGKLYALSIDGLIKRFPVNIDGTLGTPDTLYSLQDAYGARQQRLAIGFTFDPSATATNLIAWVTHSTFVFLNGPPWDGKLTRLSGNNLQNIQDVLVNLPRSAKDHLTNSIAFGPDKALYFTQGSRSAMGRADNTWDNRNEGLLSGAVLRLDVSKLGILPLDVKTSDGGGVYNPYAANAPLTIYASGVRNAYDLVWHSNGSLYIPTNGSAAGGNTPASAAGTLRPDGSNYSGPVVPGLTNVQQTQKDFLLRIVKGGYYGHPNPLRGEYVMNGGNPTTSIDPAQVNDYPVGILPDANWRGYSFDFQNNKSPDGAIEYKSNTFNGALKGKLLVVRYSQNDDIITLTPGGPNNDIISSTEGAYIEGFSGFIDPLDLTEDTLTGNIYVSEYGGDGKITLLRPKNDTSASGATVVLLPLADASVRNGNYSNKNYGNDTAFLVKTSSTLGYSRVSYLKFPLNTISKVGSAKLRVYGSNIIDTTSLTLSCYGVDTDSWGETTLTWNNAPVPQATPLTSSMVNGQLKYYEFDVTPYVNSQLGDKIVSMRLSVKDSGNGDKLMSFNSKENGQNPPRLVIDTSYSTTQSLKPLMSIALGSDETVLGKKTDSSYVHPSNKGNLFSLKERADSVNNFEKPRLYPNPLHAIFNIKFPSTYQGNYTIQILDGAGRVYETSTIRLRAGGSIMEMNISKLNLTPGVYFLRIHPDKGKIENIKLVVS